MYISEFCISHSRSVWRKQRAFNSFYFPAPGVVFFLTEKSLKSFNKILPDLHLHLLFMHQRHGMAVPPALSSLEVLKSWHITTNLYKFSATTRKFLMAKKTSIWWKTLKQAITVSLTHRKGPSWINSAWMMFHMSVLCLVKRESCAPWSASLPGVEFTTMSDKETKSNRLGVKWGFHSGSLM